MDHTKSLKHEHRLHNIVVPEFRYIRASRVVSRGRDFNTLPNRTFVAQNVCCLSLLREIVRLSQLDRGRAIALILQGRSQRDVAQKFGVYESTISRLVQRLRATGRSTDRPKSGHPRVTTQRQDRRIRLLHLRNRLRTAKETAREVIGTHGRRVCPRTVRNRLREFDLRSRRPYVGPNLTPRRRQRRMQWLRAHTPNRFRLADWRRVMFSDESRFSLQRSDRRQRVYRRLGERYSDACVREVDRFGGGGSVMVWGGISHGLKTPLVVIQGNLTVVRYRDQVLMPQVLPLVNAHNLTFQHDNARPHVARVCLDFLNQNNVQVLDWPPYSPDLNTIEHLWDALERRVRKRVNVPNNVAQLQLALIQEWNNIPQRTIDNLVGSMVRRVRAATAARGGHTLYWNPSFNNVGCLCLMQTSSAIRH